MSNWKPGDIVNIVWEEPEPQPPRTIRIVPEVELPAGHFRVPGGRVYRRNSDNSLTEVDEADLVVAPAKGRFRRWRVLPVDEREPGADEDAP